MFIPQDHQDQGTHPSVAARVLPAAYLFHWALSATSTTWALYRFAKSATVQSLPRRHRSPADAHRHHCPFCFPRECSCYASTHSFCAVQCMEYLLHVGGVRWKCEHGRR